MSPRTPIRHGEVLLLPVESVPDNAKRQQVNECIIAHSETGHHHVLESDQMFWEIVDGNDLYVDLDMPTPLRHRKDYEQHRELQVPAGKWKIVKKREFDLVKETRRLVVD